MRKENFFHCNLRLKPGILWKEGTELKPLDDAIVNINKYGYSHHIIRLMLLGNFFMLTGTEPDQAYEYFMEWFIDAYEWVMIPNVYGMALHADGGIMMTRPYFSSSNYILKMSNYKKEEWSKIWDALYYNFIHKNQDYLKKNYATSRQVYFWNKKSEEEKKQFLDLAHNYLQKISTEH
jgi:deoxyribodipyrimidine photolyase-related protein